MRKRKKETRQKEGQEALALTPPPGQSGGLIQRSLFESVSESQILVLLKELLAGLVERVEKLEQLVLECLNRLLGGTPFAEREFLTVKEFAQIVDLDEQTIRDYLNEKRIEGVKIDSGRGGKREWRIHRDELKQYQEFGLRKGNNNYRHPR